MPGATNDQLVDLAWKQVAALGTGSSGPHIADGYTNQSGCPTAVTFPGYRVIREIHRGGQGIVFEAVQESTDRVVAIKVLRRGPFADPAEFARFEREAHLLGRMNHPNIVAIHDRGTSAGHAYLIMDFVGGRTLNDYLAYVQPSIDDKLALFATVCDAVHAAHLRGIIHRDLKPANIRIGDDCQPRVLDFGLAKLMEQPEPEDGIPAVTMTGQFVGSMPWASPEQAAGRMQDLDLRGDVYSLGVILFQMLTDAFPYDVTGSTRAVQDRILHSEPTRPSSIARNIDADLDTIVLKCLAKAPDRRYQSAGDLACDIRRRMAGEPIEARRDSITYVLRKQLRRHRAATATISTGALFVIAGLIYCAAQWRRAERETRRARSAERVAETTARSLAEVASFQEAQLSAIEAPSFGVTIRRALIAETREAAAQAKLSPDETESRIRQLEAVLSGADFTRLARTALDENVLKPTRVAIDTRFGDQPLVKARLLQSLATTYHELGLFDTALLFQKEALAIRRANLGDDHRDTLHSLSDLAVILRAQGRWSDAETRQREACDRAKRILGEQDATTMQLMDRLAAVLIDQGRTAEAESLCKDTLAKRRSVLGESHRDTLDSLSTLGKLLQAQGKASEAECAFREVVDKARQSLGDDHILTISSISNLGHVLWRQDRLNEAETCFREVLDRDRRLFGVDHPDTLVAMNNMASLLRSQGSFKEAELLQRETLDQQRRILGADHPTTITSINNMAVLYFASDRLAMAEPVCREALERRRRTLGDRHPDTLNSIRNMGVLLKNLKRLAEAEPYFREYLDACRHSRGDNRPVMIASLENLADLLWMAEKPVDAEPLYQEAMTINRASQGDAHQVTIRLTGSLAGVQADLARPADAIALLSGAEIHARNTYTGDDAVHLARWLVILGRARTATGDLQAAAANLREAGEILETSKSADNRDQTGLLKALIDLDEARHAMQPDAGFDRKAAQWRTMLKRVGPG